MLDPRRVLDIGLVVISAGLLFFFVARIDRGQVPPSSETADIGVPAVEVMPSVAAERRGDKRGDSEVTRRVTMVSPSVSPTVTSVVSVSPSVQKSPSPSPFPVYSPSPVPSRVPTPSVTVTPAVSPSPAVTLSPSPAVTPAPTPTQPAGSAHVVINEIAWMGTAANPSDEWVELYNAGNAVQELSGWFLCEGDSKILSFGSSHRIEPGAFFLIERGADDMSTDITADFATSFSGSPAGLSNSGEHLTLRNGACGQGVVIDEVGPGTWYAGLASPDYVTMERINPGENGDFPSNWASNDGITVSGYDAKGAFIRGTPKARNSVAQ